MKVFVSASSVSNISKLYDDTLICISNIINKYNDTLYVGGTTGSMRLLLDNTNNHKVVISNAYKDELRKKDINNSVVVLDSFERTNTLIKESDMYIIMPGSIGSVSELISILESKRSDGNNKELILFNLNDYYDTLLKFLNETYDKGFIKEKINKYLYVINKIEELDRIRSEVK